MMESEIFKREAGKTKHLCLISYLSLCSSSCQCDQADKMQAVKLLWNPVIKQEQL